MKTLVINAGSSSIKFQVFEDETVLLKAIVEEIGGDNSKIKISIPKKSEENMLLKNHAAAFKEIIRILKEHFTLEDIKCVAHRIVHGGETFRSTTLITEEIMDKLSELTPIAPLHNPPNIEGIKIMSKLLPHAKNVGIFDTAFHSTLPEQAYLYGIPYSWYTKYHIRKFGFHGTSHKYISQEAIKRHKPNSRIITCHLGSGSSICAIKDGKSIDTSMGFTPTQGSIMGTRCGLIDPSIPQYMMNIADLSSKEVSDILNKKSGLIGLSEISSDMRILEDHKTEPAAKRAIDVFCYRLKKLIGGYVAALDGLDILIFTAGIGENSPYIRKRICEQFGYLGLKIDELKNDRNEEVISSKDSKVLVLMIKTNEELQMVREAKELLRD